jgi:hypothetical protein
VTYSIEDAASFSLLHRDFLVKPYLLFGGPATSLVVREARSFALPPHDGFAFIAAHTRMRPRRVNKPWPDEFSMNSGLTLEKSVKAKFAEFLFYALA